MIEIIVIILGGLVPILGLWIKRRLNKKPPNVIEQQAIKQNEIGKIIVTHSEPDVNKFVDDRLRAIQSNRDGKQDNSS